MTEKVTELRVIVRQFLTKSNPKYPDRKPVPMRVMFGYVYQESANGVHMVLRGKPEPSGVCLHCNRELTHPVSLLYGIGPTCGKHFHLNPFKTEEELEENFELLKEKLGAVIWSGWLPKGHIEVEATGELIEPFGETSRETSKEEVKAVEGSYPKLTVAQKELVERATSNYLSKKTPMRPTEIWIDKRGTIKVIFEADGEKLTYKIDTNGGRTEAVLPFAPKYTKVYDVNLELKRFVKVKDASEDKGTKIPNQPVDDELVDALVKELGCLF